MLEKFPKLDEKVEKILESTNGILLLMLLYI